MFWFMKRWFWSPTTLAKQDAQSKELNYIEIPLYHLDNISTKKTSSDDNFDEETKLPNNVRKIV